MIGRAALERRPISLLNSPRPLAVFCLQDDTALERVNDYLDDSFIRKLNSADLATLIEDFEQIALEQSRGSAP